MEVISTIITLQEYKIRQYKYKLFLLFTASVLSQNTVGLIINNEEKVFKGYTLFAPNNSTVTYLIGNDGRLINKWQSDYLPGLSAYLLEDGYLLRSAKVEHSENPTNNPKGGFQKFDWDNRLVWEFYYGTQHHDIEPMPNGNVLMVVTDKKTKDEAIQAGRDSNLINGNIIRSLSILEIAYIGPTDGEIVWRWDAWDHLIQDLDSTKNNYGNIIDHKKLININYAQDGNADWLHTNSVSYNEVLDQILVTNRNTNEIWIIDHSTNTLEASSHSGGNRGKGGDLLYRWGNPIAYNRGSTNDQKLFGQHDAHWMKSDLSGYENILIFNNGINRPDGVYSSIIEIEPLYDNLGNYIINAGSAYGPIEPVWTYTASIPTNFNSPKYGGAQRLSNGNTLICNAQSGELFEVNVNKEVVWKYINPVTMNGIVPQGTIDVDNNSVFRSYKYGSSYSGFFGKELTPGLSIEGDYDEDGILNGLDNCPQVFNPNQEDSNGNGVGNLCDSAPFILTIPEDTFGYIPLSSIGLDNENKNYVGLSDTSAISVSISNDSLKLSPQVNWHGVANIKVYASDGSSKDSTSLKLTVTAVNDAPTAFEWVSSALDAINITELNLDDNYNLQWDASTDAADGDSINYLVYAKIGVNPPEEINDTTSTSVSITYEEFLENVFEPFPMLPRVTVRFFVEATDGTDTVKVTGDDRVVFVNRYEYLSIAAEGIPTEFALRENYPNPFNPTTTLRFDLPEVSSITLTIYNMLGQRVRIFNMNDTPAGYHSIKWNATNDFGDPVGAGVYLYQLRANHYLETRKMVLLK